MFELVKEKLQLANVNVRLEKHGDDNVNAYDLKFTGNFPNAVLLKFDPDLRNVFYTTAAQGDIEADFFPKLRFPRIGGQSWDLEIPRTRLRLHDIDDGANDLVLGDGKTNKFSFEMLEGGTVKLAFRVQFSEMDEEHVAKLLRANGQTVPVSLECAALEEDPDYFEQADLLTQEPHSEARATAESMFLAAPASSEMTTAEPADEPAEVPEVAPKGKRGSGKKSAVSIE